MVGTALFAWTGTPIATRSRWPGSLTGLVAAGLLYTTGYGINLAANAIGRILERDLTLPGAHLTYFRDEHLGHILWHLGVVGLTLSLLPAARGAPPERLTQLESFGAAAYSVAYFTDAVEGQTVPLLLPVSVVLVGFLLLGRRRPTFAFGATPAARFFFLGQLLALGQFLTWRVWQGGFPQFSAIWNI